MKGVMRRKRQTLERKEGATGVKKGGFPPPLAKPQKGKEKRGFA